jgi:hypothetical protein
MDQEQQASNFISFYKEVCKSAVYSAIDNSFCSFGVVFLFLIIETQCFVKKVQKFHVGICVCVSRRELSI